MDEELNFLLDKSRQLNEEIEESLRRGDVGAVEQLRQAANLVWKKAMRLGSVHKKVVSLDRLPSLRERATRAITQLNVPVSAKLIAAYCEAQDQEPFDLKGLASIRRDEFRAWGKTARRNVFIVPTLEGPWFSSSRGRFALSTWPLAQRIIGPLSPRVNHLKVCLHLAERVDDASQRATITASLAKLLVDYARTVPGALEHPWDKGMDVNTSRVRQAVQDELAVLDEDEQSWRLDEAKRAARVLDENQMLWGAKLPQTVEKAAD
jgi:hypothetical protein